MFSCRLKRASLIAAPSCAVLLRLRGGRCLRRELPSRMVDGVFTCQDQLTDGHHGVALVDEVLQNAGQCLRRMQRGVVEQHDAPRLHLGRHPLIDGVRVVVLPIQGIPIGNDLKPLRHKGLRVWPLCASAKKLTCKWSVWRAFQARKRSKLMGCAQGWRGG